MGEHGVPRIVSTEYQEWEVRMGGHAVPRMSEHGVPRMGEYGVPRMGEHGVPRIGEHEVLRMGERTEYPHRPCRNHH